MRHRASTESPASIPRGKPVVAIDDRGPLNVLRSSRGLLVFVLMLLIFTGAAQPITDPDFWWHLRTGQYIVETKSIPYTDIFSTLRFGSEWVTHEWLSEVFMYSIFRVLGYGGLIVIFSILITGAFWIVYQRCRKRGVHPYVAGFALFLGAAATMPTWGVRPQMFSLLFASMFISFLDRYSRLEAMPSIWWLAPLMILWVNMHAGFALGLVLIVLTIAGLLLDWLLLRKDSFADVWRRARPLCWLLIICVAAVSLNPNGIRLYSYPFETLTSQAMMQYIQEWKAPNFHEPMFQALALLLIATFSALALSGKRARPGELLTLAATAWATLRSGRNVAFFALVATPLLAEHSWNWLTSQRWGLGSALHDRRRGLGTKSTWKVSLNALLLLLALGVVILGIGRAVAKQPVIEAQEFPAAAVDFIRDQKPQQPIYNEYIWGGYLIWRLYPDYRVYIDGRADVYGDGLINEFLQVKDGRTAWREPLDNHGIRTVLVKPDAALASLLRQDGAWQKIFEDKQSVIFVRR
ncbi:MAG: hypothetical protein H0V18_03245 [Pyrinomonadaceae bacterium]|nr:hypothetical protein [Pyrinomonadaceae bacterium]